MKLNLLIILLFSLITAACTVEVDEVKKGPENSWWLGGVDGGVFLKVEDDNNLSDNFYQGVIFYEHDKTVWYRGPFKLVGDNKLDTDNHDLYLFWDGDKIHLKESSYLEAVNAILP